MDSISESLAAWGTFLGAVVSLLGLIQSLTWLTALGAVFIAVSIAAIAYARRKGRRLRSASIVVEGRNLDSLNLANLRRRLNRTLVVQEANHVARIQGEDLQITWRYAGYCRANRESAIEFSVDSDNNIPFDALDCFGYDLKHDPDGKHKIRPILIGPDGVSKKIALPFLRPITRDQGFDAVLKCELPGCMNGDVEYYSSTLAFDQIYIPRCTVHLRFVLSQPEWVRLYDCGASGRAKLMKDLPAVRVGREFSEYSDVADNISGQSVRVYVFRRDMVL